MPPAPESIRLTRPQCGFDPPPRTLLSAGGWCNANVFVAERAGRRWVVKDFLHCPAPVRHTWAVWTARRELRVLRRLEGIPGVPSGAFPIDRHAFGYEFVEGRALKFVDRRSVPSAYFEALEQLVIRIHDCGIAHLDLRNRHNILVTADWKPAVVDFESHVRLDRIPRGMCSFVKRIDLSGVYKYWAKIHPESLGPERSAMLARAERWRRLWPLQGYAGSRRWHAERAPATPR
jgi:RIO-like serine/threonine protein kinase